MQDIEIKILEEDHYRTRSCFGYWVEVKLDGKRALGFLDLNHRIFKQNGRIYFERKDSNYNYHGVFIDFSTIDGNINIEELARYLNEEFLRQQESWKNVQ